jgi:hypothetical protein
MGYKGKSSAATAAAILLVYGGYFLWPSESGPSVAGAIGRMIATIVLLAVVVAVFEVFIQLFERRGHAAGQMSDERDALIAARGARNGYYALLSVLWIAPVMVLMGLPAMFTANCLLGMIVLAEIVHFASRAIYDARGS